MVSDRYLLNFWMAFDQTCIDTFSPRASNTFNQVAEAIRIEGVFLCRKVC